MPQYTDENGVTKTRDEYPGNSYKAKVINRALRQGDFVWAEVPSGSGKWWAFFTCCQCKGLINDAGVAGDHNIAQAHGGSNDMWNLQILCCPCNETDAHHRGGVKTRSQYRLSGKWKPASNDDGAA
jgi:5-methylcytosine-specific restriction endonuclease McrA